MLKYPYAKVKEITEIILIIVISGVFFSNIKCYKSDSSDGPSSRRRVSIYSLGKGGWPSGSPDGKKIAYLLPKYKIFRNGSKHLEALEIYVMRSDGKERKSTGERIGDSDIFWLPDSRNIIFLQNHHLCMFDIYLNKKSVLGYFAQKLPTLSPDGKRIAVVKSFSNSIKVTNIYVMNVDGSHPHRVTNFTNQNDSVKASERLSWSPDETCIAFVREKSYAISAYGGISRRNIWIVNTDGTGLRQLTSCVSDYYPSWSPNGEKIAFVRSDDIYIIKVDGSKEEIVPTRGCTSCLSWAPDGKRLVFSDGEEDNVRIWIVSLP